MRSVEPSTTSSCARPLRARARRPRLPLPRRHRRRRARDPGAALRLGRAEWWAPQADATAPYVNGVLERFPELSSRTTSTPGWRGRHGLGRARRRGALDGRGWFVLETIAGELPDGARARPRSAAAARWLPFAAGGRRGAARAARRAARPARAALRDAPAGRPRARAGATLSLVDSVGEPRFTLDVNWDPDTIPAFLRCPAARRTAARCRRPLPRRAARALPAHATTSRSRGAARSARPAARRARRGDRASPPLARPRGRAARGRGRLGGELQPFQRAGVRYVLGRGARSSPTSRASARPSRRSPRSRPTTRSPRSSSARPA